MGSCVWLRLAMGGAVGLWVAMCSLAMCASCSNIWSAVHFTLFCIYLINEVALHFIITCDINDLTFNYFIKVKFEYSFLNYF